MTDLTNKKCPYEDTNHPPLYERFSISDSNPSEPIYQIRRNHMGSHDTVIKTGLTEVEAKAAFLDTLLEMGYWPTPNDYGSISYYVCYEYGAHGEAIWISPQPPLSEALLKKKDAQRQRAKLRELSKERKRKKLENELKKSWEKKSIKDDEANTLASKFYFLNVRVRDCANNICHQKYFTCSETLTLKQLEKKIIEKEGKGYLLNQEYDPYVKPSSLKHLGYTRGSSVDFVLEKI